MKILNFKSSLIALVLGAMGLNASAQEGNYVFNNFWDNWFISAGAGTQIYWGNSPNVGTIRTSSDRMSMTFNGSLGKWISPSIGLRGQMSYTPEAKMYRNNVDMKIFNMHGDMMFNLTNMFGGYKPTRFYQPVVYVGAGIASVKLSTPGALRDNTLTANAGMINKFRLGNRVDLNIELASMFLPQGTDGFTEVAGGESRPFDASLTATAGITYKFGGDKEFVRNVPAVEVDLTPYNNKIRELENEVSAANSKAAELNRKLVEMQNRPVVKENVVVASSIPALSTFYNINSSKLGARELVNLDAIAAYIKTTPDAKYKLAGLVDYSTGSRQYNDKLSASRVDAVHKELVRLGVKENQLVKSTEAPASPHKNPILNRGVVITAVK